MYFCPIFILIGLILLLVGGYKWNVILSLVGFLGGFFGIVFLLNSTVNYTSDAKSYLIIGGIALMVGILTAALCNTFNILSVISLGAVAGYFLSSYILILTKFHGENWLLYLIEIGSAVLIAVLCILLKKTVLVFLTSILGSFLIFYFIGFWCTLVPNFFDLIQKIKSGDDIPTAVYIFSAIIILFAVLGMVFQTRLILKHNRDKSDNESERLLTL